MYLEIDKAGGGARLRYCQSSLIIVRHCLGNCKYDTNLYATQLNSFI